MAFTIKQHDTLPNLPFRIFKPDGITPQDLTDATSVSIVVRTKGAASGAAPTFKKSCTLLDQAVEENIGWGFYDWVEVDTAAAGEFDYEFEILWEDGNIQTVPAGSYLALVIVADIG